MATVLPIPHELPKSLTIVKVCVRDFYLPSFEG